MFSTRIPVLRILRLVFNPGAKWVVRIWQEYSRLIFMENLRILRLRQKNTILIKKACMSTGVLRFMFEFILMRMFLHWINSNMLLWLWVSETGYQLLGEVQTLSQLLLYKFFQGNTLSLPLTFIMEGVKFTGTFA